MALGIAHDDHDDNGAAHLTQVNFCNPIFPSKEYSGNRFSSMWRIGGFIGGLKVTYGL